MLARCTKTPPIHPIPSHPSILPSSQLISNTGSANPQLRLYRLQSFEREKKPTSMEPLQNGSMASRAAPFLRLLVTDSRVLFSSVNSDRGQS